MECFAHNAPDRVIAPAERRLSRYVRFSAVAAIVVLASAVLLFALSGHRSHVHASLGKNPAACVGEVDDTARLECYDAALNRAQAHPARGATAPIGL